MTLTELAERAEKATGPDRELDWLIYATLNPDNRSAQFLADVKPKHRYLYGENYTASIDAAMYAHGRLAMDERASRELLEALQPFWKYVQCGGAENWGDLEWPPNLHDFINLGDIRRADAAFIKHGGLDTLAREAK